MSTLKVALLCEFTKARKAKIFWIMILAFLFITCMIGLIMFVIKNPDSGKKFGLIGSKAALLRFQKTDWATFLGLLNQVIAGLGIVGFGLVATWVFGREYSDHTAKDLLALPVPRSAIVLAKFLVIIVWALILAATVFFVGLWMGRAVSLDDWSAMVFSVNAARFLKIFLLTLPLCFPVAYIASASKGYMAPFGFVLGMMFLAQMSGLVSLNLYFPWSIPISLATENAPALPFASYVSIFITGIAGLVATFLQWMYADQT